MEVRSQEKEAGVGAGSGGLQVVQPCEARARTLKTQNKAAMCMNTQGKFLKIAFFLRLT
jgi:hypothetical protein